MHVQGNEEFIGAEISHRESGGRGFVRGLLRDFLAPHASVSTILNASRSTATSLALLVSMCCGIKGAPVLPLV